MARNRYPGTCYCCGTHTPAGYGILNDTVTVGGLNASSVPVAELLKKLIRKSFEQEN